MSAKVIRFRVSYRVVLTLLGVLLLPLAFPGCGPGGRAPVYDTYGPAPPGYYRIRRGDTLSKIAARHRVGYKTLARWNKLSPPYRIYAGALLRVEPPDRRSRSAGRSATGTAKTTTERSRTASQGTAETSAGASKEPRSSGTKVASGLRWLWPLEGKVVQRFRAGDRTQQGIRIVGRPGQKVLAAEGGTVVYSGSGLKGYGNLIIVKHDGSYLSAYGYNQRLLVSEGVRVKRGQVIAEVGQASGGGYRLHFEIRRSGTAVDPLRYLP